MTKPKPKIPEKKLVVKPKPKPIIPKTKPEKFVVLYRSLMLPYENWAETFKSKREMEEFKKNPGNSDLQIAILLKIYDELKRSRVLR